MQRTRVVLVDVPRILGDIVKDAVAHQADMEVVADIASSPSLPSVVSETNTDVVVIGRELLGYDLELLRGCPGVAVLALVDDGRHALRYRLRPEPVRPDKDGANGISTELIVAAIRAEAQELARHSQAR